MGAGSCRAQDFLFGRGDDTVGNPRRAQFYQFELFELKFVSSTFSLSSNSRQQYLSQQYHPPPLDPDGAGSCRDQDFCAPSSQVFSNSFASMSCAEMHVCESHQRGLLGRIPNAVGGGSRLGVSRLGAFRDLSHATPLYAMRCDSTLHCTMSWYSCNTTL